MQDWNIRTRDTDKLVNQDKNGSSSLLLTTLKWAKDKTTRNVKGPNGGKVLGWNCNAPGHVVDKCSEPPFGNIASKGNRNNKRSGKIVKDDKGYIKNIWNIFACVDFIFLENNDKGTNYWWIGQSIYNILRNDKHNDPILKGFHQTKIKKICKMVRFKETEIQQIRRNMFQDLKDADDENICSTLNGNEEIWMKGDD